MILLLKILFGVLLFFHVVHGAAKVLFSAPNAQHRWALILNTPLILFPRFYSMSDEECIVLWEEGLNIGDPELGCHVMILGDSINLELLKQFFKSSGGLTRQWSQRRWKYLWEYGLSLKTSCELIRSGCMDVDYVRYAGVREQYECALLGAAEERLLGDFEEACKKCDSASIQRTLLQLHLIPALNHYMARNKLCMKSWTGILDSLPLQPFIDGIDALGLDHVSFEGVSLTSTPEFQRLQSFSNLIRKDEWKSIIGDLDGLSALATYEYLLLWTCKQSDCDILSKMPSKTIKYIVKELLLDNYLKLKLTKDSRVESLAQQLVLFKYKTIWEMMENIFHANLALLIMEYLTPISEGDVEQELCDF